MNDGNDYLSNSFVEGTSMMKFQSTFRVDLVKAISQDPANPALAFADVVFLLPKSEFKAHSTMILNRFDAHRLHHDDICDAEVFTVQIEFSRQVDPSSAGISFSLRWSHTSGGASFGRCLQRGFI